MNPELQFRSIIEGSLDLMTFRTVVLLSLTCRLGEQLIGPKLRNSCWARPPEVTTYILESRHFVRYRQLINPELRREWLQKNELRILLEQDSEFCAVLATQPRGVSTAEWSIMGLETNQGLIFIALEIESENPASIGLILVTQREHQASFDQWLSHQRPLRVDDVQLLCADPYELNEAEGGLIVASDNSGLYCQGQTFAFWEDFQLNYAGLRLKTDCGNLFLLALHYSDGFSSGPATFVRSSSTKVDYQSI